MKKMKLFYCWGIITFFLQFNSFASNYYVSTFGKDSNDGLSVETAWLTIAKACSAVPANGGHVINIGAGTFYETSQINLPSGITILGAGKSQTTIQSSGSRIFYAKNKSNIVISDFKIDGRGRATPIGFRLEFCSGIEIKNFTMTEFTTSVDFRSGTNNKVHDFDGTNVSYCTQNGISITNWVTDICENFEIYNGNCTNDDNYHGKIVGGGVDQTMPGYDGRPWDMPDPLFKNIKIHDIRFRTSHEGCFLVGQPQLGLEFWKGLFDNCEIYNMKCNMAFSMAVGCAPGSKNPLRIHHCRWENCGDYAIECFTGNMEIDHNYFDGCYYPIGNFGTNPNNLMPNLQVHHNVFYRTYNNTCMNMGESFNGIKFFNNTIYTLSKENVFNLPGSINIEVNNNIFYSTVSGGNAGGLVNANYHDNLFFKYNPIGTNVSTEDPLFNVSGEKPTQFFNLTSASPQKTYGAYPYGEEAWTAGPSDDIILGYSPVPGKIEAENFVSMSGIQTGACTDTDGGFFVGWIHNSDWMEYNINPSSPGLYKIDLRISDYNSAGNVKIKTDTTVLAKIPIPVTGGWTVYNTISGNINLQAGKQTLRFEVAQGGWRINWFNISNSATSTNAYMDITKEVVNIYPNPSSGLVTIELLNCRNAQVKIYNMCGQLLSSQQISKAMQQLDLSGETGLLLIKVITENQSFSKKILINNI